MIEKKISDFWEKISNIGIDSDTSSTLGDRIRLLNRLVSCLLFFLTLVLLQDLVRNEWIKIYFYCPTYIFLIITFLLNYYKKYLFAITIFIFLSLSLALLLSSLFGQVVNPQFIYITLILCIVFLVEKSVIRYCFYTLTLLIFFIGEFIMNHLNPILVCQPTLLDRNGIFIASAACTFLIANLYVHQSKENTKKLNDSLAEVKNQNEELNNAYMDLEQFTYILSHDLKTPIRSIVSFLDLIQRKTSYMEDIELDEYVQFAKQGGKKMNDVVNGVLEYSKLNFSKEIDYEEVSLEEIAISTFDSIKTLAIKKNASLVTENLPNLVSNKFLLKNLFQNIIENGLLYNDSNEPEVYISMLQNQSSWIITFKDNGRGIELAYQKQIFDIFQQIEFESEEFQGVGIGLSICKKIVQRLGGKIELFSNIGEGTTVNVELPIIKLKSV